MKELILVKIDKKYCDYLRKFDSKVPYNFSKKENRPFVGVLFSIDEFLYFAPLSSPKPKHLKLKGKLDLLKIDKGKLGVVNFNNMIPVKPENIVEINLNAKGKSIKEDKYFKLLKEQLYWLNRHSEKIHGRSKTLYDKYINNTLNKNVVNRCCDFKLLERKCQEYN